MQVGSTLKIGNLSSNLKIVRYSYYLFLSSCTPSAVCSVRHAHENHGVSERRAHSARYLEGANGKYFDLERPQHFSMNGGTDVPPSLVPLRQYLQREPGR
jgi:hypothetical protein